MKVTALALRPGDVEVLHALSQGTGVSERVSKRARAVLLASQGRSNRDIAAAVGLHYNQVSVWRSRYAQLGLAGLEDSRRSGRPCTYEHKHVLLLLSLLTRPAEDGAATWSMQSLAEAMARRGVPISSSQCWRICASMEYQQGQSVSWLEDQATNF